MRAAWHDIWGCAHGPAKRLAPQSRILVGTGVFLACLIAPASTLPGAAFAMALCLFWLAMCWPPLRTMRATLSFGLSVLLSSVLTIYLLALATDTSSLATCLGLLVGGVSALITTLATVTTLSMSDLRVGLLRLPVPAMVSAILLQMIHQTATLGYETRRMAAAIAVRGATSTRASGLKILTSLPRVWLPRVLERADRVATAMEVRGYEQERRSGLGLVRTDLPGLTMAAIAMASAVFLRYWSLR